MSDTYVLDKNNNVIPEPNLIRWATWLESADRKIARETIGDSDISTVFLGIDHSFGVGDPLLFETMVFGGQFDDEQERCGTMAGAIKMHDLMCAKVRAQKNGRVI